MAKTTTHIELDSVTDIIDNWTKSINDFEANKPIAFNSGSDGFYRIRDAGFSTEGIQKYDSNVDKLIQILRNYSLVITDYLNSMTDADIDIESKMPVDGKAVTTTSSSTKASSIDVDSKIGEISSSSMSELDKESERLKKQKQLQASMLRFRSKLLSRPDIVRFYKRLLQKSEYDASKYRIKCINLQNINKSLGGMSNYNGYYSINRKYPNQFNNNYTIRMVGFDDTGFYKSGSKYDNSKFNKWN